MVEVRCWFLSFLTLFEMGSVVSAESARLPGVSVRTLVSLEAYTIVLSFMWIWGLQTSWVLRLAQ